MSGALPEAASPSKGCGRRFFSAGSTAAGIYTIAVADKKGGFHVTCHALRLFSLDEFKSWLGNEQHLVDPSANSLHIILQRSVAAF